MRCAEGGSVVGEVLVHLEGSEGGREGLSVGSGELPTAGRDERVVRDDGMCGLRMMLFLHETIGI